MSNTSWAILSGEYPPAGGGVADYTFLVAEGLARAGDDVHVFTPVQSDATSDAGVHVHALPADQFGRRTRSMLDAELARLPVETIVLVQYTPQAFGRRGMNWPMCLWLWRRRRRFEVWVMFHEVHVPATLWRPGIRLRLTLLGMTTIGMAKLMRAAGRRCFVSTPRWADILRRWDPSTNVTWLPVPSNVPTTADEHRVAEVRATAAARVNSGTQPVSIIGHFGSYAGPVAATLRQLVPRLLEDHPSAIILLIGRGSDAFARSLGAGRVIATGAIAPADVAAHLAACDVLVQPFIDGITTRRSSAMAGLALGVPVVTTAGELTEPLWAESRAVALAPVDDVDALRRAVTDLLARPDERRALGDRGRALYDERFHLRHTIAVLRAAACDEAAVTAAGATTQRDPAPAPAGGRS